jgi:predicted DCC family thiol-disulfide oxidoreductase YuxK
MTRTVMVYDGACGLCTSSMRVVRRLDWRQRIEYLDAQDWATVQRRYPTLDREAILGLIHVITPDGRILVGYPGVRALLRELPLLMVLYPLLFLPGITWLGPRVYDWIAARRYWFNRVFGDPCTDGVCRVHTGE